MIHQINPNENFPIARQLEDPSDSNKYYVQAKVYNGSDNTLLSTQNLTDNGNQFFSVLYQAPGDSSGNGRYIYIITRVYTDAGYTTVSSRYGIALDTYLLQYRVNASGFSGGGSYYDYGKTDKLTRKAITDLVALIVRKEIEPLAKKKLDLSNVEELIRVSAKSIREKIPQPTDLSGVLKSHEETRKDMEKILAEIVEGAEAVSSELQSQNQKHFEKSLERIAEKLSLNFDDQYGEMMKRIRDEQAKFEDRIMAEVSGIIEENLGKTSVQISYPKKEKVDAKPKGLTREQEREALKLLRTGMSREKVMEKILA